MQNNGITKIQGELSHNELYDFISSGLERKYLLNFAAPLVIIRRKFREGRFRKKENFKTVSWKNQNRSRFFYAVCAHSFFRNYSDAKIWIFNRSTKIYRMQNSKITNKYFNEIALMECENLDIWIVTVTCQKTLEALENDIIVKKLFADVQPR